MAPRRGITYPAAGRDRNRQYLEIVAGRSAAVLSSDGELSGEGDVSETVVSPLRPAFSRTRGERLNQQLDAASTAMGHRGSAADLELGGECQVSKTVVSP
jgi:hypothetical protein